MIYFDVTFFYISLHNIIKLPILFFRAFVLIILSREREFFIVCNADVAKFHSSILHFKSQRFCTSTTPSIKKMQINLNNFDVISIWCLHDRIDTFCCCRRQLVDGAFCLVLSQLLSLHSEEFNVNKLKFLRMLLVLAIIDLKPTIIWA